MPSAANGWEPVRTKPAALEVIPEHVPPPIERGRRFDSPIARRFSPRRNRWADVAAFDSRAQELERRIAEMNTTLEKLENERRQAAERDHLALVTWQLQDRRGKRPESSAPGIEEEIKRTTADRDAAIVARDRVYEEKAEYVEKLRKRLTKETAKATEQARERYLSLISQLGEAREELVAARETELWAQFFPRELASELPATGAVCAGFRAPVEAATGLQVQLNAASLLHVLESDAEVLATLSTTEQARELGTIDPNHGAATWVDTEEGQRQARKQREEARQRYRATSGNRPGVRTYPRSQSRRAKRSREASVSMPATLARAPRARPNSGYPIKSLAISQNSTSNPGWGPLTFAPRNSTSSPPGTSSPCVSNRIV